MVFFLITRCETIGVFLNGFDWFCRVKAKVLLSYSFHTF